METLELRVKGMTCDGCERRIGAVLRRVEGVREVNADHSTGRVRIRVGPELINRAALRERVETAGFEVVEGVDR